MSHHSVLIGHSVRAVGLLEKKQEKQKKHNTWFQCYFCMASYKEGGHPLISADSLSPNVNIVEIENLILD